jgi:kynurenine formamidase
VSADAPRQERGELANLLGDCRLVDLTLTVAEELPCSWPTHLAFQHKTFNYFVDRPDAAQPLLARTGPYQTRWMVMDEHTGTHFDAPSHFIPPPESGLPHAGPAGELTADRIDPRQFFGPASVIDVPPDLPGAAPGVSPEIRPELVAAWEHSHGRLRGGDVVLFRTGWDQRYRPDGGGYAHDVLVTHREPGWPAPGPEAMTLLLERGIRCVGTDTPSMGSAHDGAPVHVRGLEAGAVYVEGLTGLSALPPRGAYFVFLPIKVRHGTGAPGRAVALLPATDQRR